MQWVGKSFPQEHCLQNTKNRKKTNWKGNEQKKYKFFCIQISLSKRDGLGERVGTAEDSNCDLFDYNSRAKSDDNNNHKQARYWQWFYW